MIEKPMVCEHAWNENILKPINFVHARNEATIKPMFFPEPLDCHGFLIIYPSRVLVARTPNPLLGGWFDKQKHNKTNGF